MVLKGGMDNRARKRAFDEIFTRFDRNKNGRLYVKDFIEELRLVEVNFCKIVDRVIN